jgi:hypothetical protein
MARPRRQAPGHVTCRLCRKEFKAITFRHLRNVHGYEGDHPILDYKDRFRLRTAMCLESRQKISAAKDTFWARQGQHWTPRKVVAEIRRLRRAGKRLSCKDVPVRLYEAARRLFGSWEQALAAARLDYEEATGTRRWDRAKVVAEIKKLAARNAPLHASHVEGHFPQLFHAATRQFPRSWARALRAAGLDPEEHRMPRGRWTRAKAERWVRERVARGGSILARDAPRDLLGFVWNRLGGSWTGFVESLGIPYPGVKKRRDWTRAKVLSEIRRWKAEGHPLGYKRVQHGYQALLHQAKKFFGTWDGARAAAGV